jgi:hypothetical protein
MAHAYNPSYSGGRDQEDLGLKPTQANSLWDPISKIASTKKGWWSDPSGRVPAEQVWGPEFKLQYNHQKKKKKMEWGEWMEEMKVSEYGWWA